MKKYLNVCMAMIVSLLILQGCKKAVDFLENHPYAGQGFCQVGQFSYLNSYLVPDTMIFTYNLLNNPVTGIRHPRSSTGYPNFIFRYDKYNRFTDLIGAFDINNIEYGVESWDRYFYDSFNRIIKDSSYIFPSIVNGEPALGGHAQIQIITYEYDSKNRVSKEIKVFGARALTSTYTYDQHGNLAGIPHDNKINIHRTNKIWMFLDKDYSINNPATASYTYNNYGLPIKIVPNTGTMEFMSIGYTSLEYVEAEIQYMCK